MIYDFHPDAQQELQDAVAYYDSINQELAHAFLDEIEHTLENFGDRCNASTT
ncbi:MAG: type II toxin-antitoxin system RelE/ParE family toxin [Coleofasciculus sp. A1-SPW-01]|uniref:type II toxin-antitoxin system RelE/ParE family toxin n=1 Tax=Coleofasciculus TaxID=669368 RepID=UPI0002FC72D3|nr:type II toxin-antitoxin system RelE/ParE family toxin [Coleofasciculus chthonoplastes]